MEPNRERSSPAISIDVADKIPTAGLAWLEGERFPVRELIQVKPATEVKALDPTVAARTRVVTTEMLPTEIVETPIHATIPARGARVIERRNAKPKVHPR